jgi:hypothetical protein
LKKKAAPIENINNLGLPKSCLLSTASTTPAAATLAGAGFAFYFKKHRIKPTVNP